MSSNNVDNDFSASYEPIEEYCARNAAREEAILARTLEALMELQPTNTTRAFKSN